MLAYLLKPSNLIIAALAVLMAVTWAGYQTKKVQLAECQGQLGICQKDVQGFQAEISSAQGIIEALRKNIDGIKKQMENWKQIAAEAQEFGQRILAAAESKKDCEVYHEENARLTDEFVAGFNSRVRGKINRPAPADHRAAPEVLPKAGPTGPDHGNQ